MALGHGRWMRDARSRLFVPETSGSTPGFNPADFGADFSWWAARLESYANGAAVPTWTDRGSGTLTVTGASGQEPEFRDGTDPVAPNGQPCVRYANGDRLLNTVTGVTGPWTAAVVCRPTALSFGNNPLIGGTPSFSTSSIRFRSNSGGQCVAFVGTAGANASPTVPPGAGYNPISPLGWHVVVCTIGIPSLTEARLLVFKSGLTVAASPNNYINLDINSGSVIDVAAGVFCVGGNTYVGEIAEAVLWRSAISNADKITIGKQLSDLYGVTY